MFHLLISVRLLRANRRNKTNKPFINVNIHDEYEERSADAVTDCKLIKW